MEICTRAISFWTYQTAQEARFQEMTQKSTEDKLGSLEKQLQKMTRDVNAELSGWASFSLYLFLVVLRSTIMGEKLTVKELVRIPRDCEQ